MWGRGFGRGFGGGWNRGMGFALRWGIGRGFGRGFGFGARLGYCPWTGLPRGWRWGYGYTYNAYTYGANAPYLPNDVSPYGYNAQYGTGSYGTNYSPYAQVDMQNEAAILRKRLDEITKRIEELEGK